MKPTNCRCSVGRYRAAAGAMRWSLVALVAAVLGVPGCGGAPGQATQAPEQTPDQQAKVSRDYSRALHEKTKGRPARH